MKQTIHILKKDIRYLRLEIGMVMAMAVSFGWMHNRAAYPWWVLLVAAATFLVVRVIQAEPIPGDKQFWITRPYNPTSLLSAKLGFIVLFVNLPVGIAQLVVFLREGFPLAPNLYGIVWVLLLTIFGLTLPVAALAALCPGLMQFTLSGILLYATAQGMVLYIRQTAVPDEVDWIRYSIAALPVGIMAIWSLWSQYRSRRTPSNRAIAVSVVALGLFAASFVPLGWTMAIQSQMSDGEFASSTFQIELDSVNPPRTPFSIGRQRVRLEFPLVVRNVPDDGFFKASLFNVTLAGRDGEVWEPPGVYGAPVGTFSKRHLDQWVGLPISIFDAWSGGPVRVRGTFYLTVFGEPQEETFVLSTDPVNLKRGLQCYAYDVALEKSISCRLPFRSPPFVMSARRQDEELGDFGRAASYSPFPAGIDMNRIWEGWILFRKTLYSDVVTYDLREGQEITMVVQEPVAHLHRDFSVVIDLPESIEN